MKIAQNNKKSEIGVKLDLLKELSIYLTMRNHIHVNYM